MNTTERIALTVLLLALIALWVAYAIPDVILKWRAL